MSKLSTVKKALEENQKIVIVAVEDQNYLPYRDGYWSHTVNICIAPKSGMYEASDLQELMMSLVPTLKFTCKDDFRDGRDELEYGKLYFDETIGTEVIRRELTLTEEDATCKEFTDGKLIIEETRNIERRTWVRLYPDEKIAAKALEGFDEYRISRDKLEKSKGVFRRIVEAVTGK